MVTPEQDGRQLRGQQRARGLRERADRQRHRLHHRHCADAPSGVRAGNEGPFGIKNEPNGPWSCGPGRYEPPSGDELLAQPDDVERRDGRG
jgi:hypothetical protein